MKKIKQAVKFKCLGVWFDQHLNWDDHRHILAGKISMKIGQIKRAIPFLTKSTRKLLVSTLVMAHFDYSNEVWSSASRTSLKRLERLYRRASKLTSDENNMALQDFLDKKLAILMFNCLNGLAPSCLQEKCILTSSLHQNTLHHVNMTRYMLSVGNFAASF